MFSLKRKKKILILWYSIDRNLGDYYLYKTVCDYATEWGYEVKGMDVGLSYKAIAKEALKYDWLWFAGGGIIERDIPDVIRHFEKFHKRVRRINYGITGLSIGIFDYSNEAEAISYWVNHAAFFYTRDRFSANELNRLGNSARVKASVDVVFACKEINSTAAVENNCVGINFRTMPYVDLTGEIDWNGWNKAITSCIKEKIVGIPDQIDVSEKVNFVYPMRYTPENAVRIMSTIKYGVAMRYHVVLIAARLGKVCIPIDYCPKVTRLAEQLGLSELCVHAGEPERLEDVLNEYQNDENNYKRRVKKNVEKMERIACEMFNEVKEIMEETKIERKIFI